jgi:hypothetical protein
VKDTGYLNEIVKQMTNKRNIVDWILDSKYDQKMDRVWLNALLSFGEDAFNGTVQYIQNHIALYDAFDINKWLFKTVLPQLFMQKRKDDLLVEQYIQTLVSLYGNYNSNKIRALFFDMLSPSRFKDKELVLKIVDRYVKIGVPPKYQQRIEEIRDNTDSNSGYESVENIFTEVTNGKHDFTKIATLNYIAFQLQKTDNTIIQDLYLKYSDYNEVVQILSYFIAKFILGKNRELTELISRPMTDAYLRQITEYIDEYRINTTKTRDYLNQVGEHGVLAKFTRR